MTARDLVRAGTILVISVLIRAAAFPAPETTYWEVRDVDELLEAASAIQPKRGGTIRLLPGSYLLNETITFRNTYHVSLHGSGWNTTLIRRGAGDAILFEDSQFCFVRDLHIAGSPESGTGSAIVYRGYSSSCTIDTCRMENFPESGVRYEGRAEKPMSTNSIRNCHFIGNRGDQLWSRHNNDFYIIGNQFGSHWSDGEYEPSRCGARLDHSAAGTYSMNYHWGNVNALILAAGCHFNRFIGNRFEESREAGVIIGSASPPTGQYFNIFTGNTFHTNSQSAPGNYSALVAHHAADFTFTGNQVFSWNSADYLHKSSLELLDGCQRWIVTGNSFAHNAGPAIMYDENAGHVVEQNITR